MINQLQKLPTPEAELILKAPLLICILIAGADNDIDKKEIRKAVQLTKAKRASEDSKLTGYYQLIAEDFEDKLKILMQSFPAKAEKRNPIIIDQLQGLNTILTKLNRAVAIEYYQSLREIAKETAESSGGLLGLNSVGEEESKFIDLPMINELK
jgi:hypothetical protein